jgi:hypothetical protein
MSSPETRTVISSKEGESFASSLEELGLREVFRRLSEEGLLPISISEEQLNGIDRAERQRDLIVALSVLKDVLLKDPEGNKEDIENKVREIMNILNIRPENN